MTITEREGFGAYGHGIRPNKVPGMPYGPNSPTLGDGKSEFGQEDHQGRTVIGTHEGVVIRATRALRPITAASHGGQDWCMRGCGPVIRLEETPISVENIKDDGNRFQSWPDNPTATPVSREETTAASNVCGLIQALLS